MNDDERRSVDNAIDLIRCAGYDVTATFLAKENDPDEGDIEVIEAPEKDAPMGFCWPLPFGLGEWIYIHPDLLVPIEPGAKSIERCDAHIVRLATTLWHEAQHALYFGRTHTDIYRDQVRFIEALESRFDECFKDCDEIQKGAIRRALSYKKKAAREEFADD